MDYLYQVVKAERKVVEGYRKGLLEFVVGVLNHYEYYIEDHLIWFLLNKYFVEA
jgi:hypothetical protein